MAQHDVRFRIAVDTGGTFTDVVVSGDGKMAVGKALTTAVRVSEGFLASLHRAAQTMGRTGEQVLRSAEVIVYGTTHATNAVLTGRTARTALLVTEGFADTLILREGGRRNVFDTRVAYPPPYVPRRLTFELRERVSAEGEIVKPLEEEHARGVIRALEKHDVEAVAVMLVWSVANSNHERRVGSLIEELLPDIPYTLSVEANTAVREYRRASAASIDASLKPLMRAHLGDLRADLAGAGFAGDVMVVTSEGAVLDIDVVIDRPVLTLNSGPSMAPLVGAAAAPEADVVVVCDMGGTTFDVSLVEHGRVRHTREAWLGEPFIGHLTGLSSVAVKSIGAGGGSIAWIDSGGLLRVGPQSAGSDPGPVAYGRGGELPTVTDACVVLGYLDAERFQAGFQLDRDAAESAIARRVGEPLGLSPTEAAQAVLDVSANHMASAIRQATLEQGVDPRGAIMVAGGGAGPMLAAAIADVLEARHAFVPGTAGVLAAYGAHEASIATEYSIPHFVDTGDFDTDSIEQVLDQLDAHATAFLNRFATDGTEPRRSYFVDARYPAQAWDLRVQFPGRPHTSETGGRTLEESFHREHLHRNGIQDPGSRVEVLTWGVRAEAARLDGRAPSLPRSAHEGPLRTDEVVFGARLQATPRYGGGSLKPDQVVVGPAVIDEPTTTVVIPPGWRAHVDDQRGFHLFRDEDAA